MRKALSAVASHLINPNPRLSVAYRSFIAGISSHPNPPACTESHGSILRMDRFHPCRTNSSRNLSTQADRGPQISSRQRKRNEKSELMKAFESAKTKEQMLRAYEDMEGVFKERELVSASIKVGLKLDQEGDDPERILSLAIKAHNTLTISGKPSLRLVLSLQLMGSACCRLTRFDDSLDHLNRAHKVLGSLEEKDFGGVDARQMLLAVELKLANVMFSMGRKEDGLVNLRKSVKLKEDIFEKHSTELGAAYHDMAKACAEILNFKEALPYCMKALEIHTHLSGRNSVEVARDRQLLGVIHGGLGELEKALEYNELSKEVLMEASGKDESSLDHGISSDLLSAEIDSVNLQVSVGKYDDALNSLKSAVKKTEAESHDRALLLITMGKTLCLKENFGDAKKCLKLALGILRRNETVCPLEVSQAYMEIASQYEDAQELELSISILRRALSMLKKLPREQQTEGLAFARIGWLHLLKGRVSQAVPYLESAAETFKECFGPKHHKVGNIYQKLGNAYLELDKPQLAAEIFAEAKDIMDASYGPLHSLSIEAFQDISKAFAAMGNYSRAIDFQQRAIDSWASHGAAAQLQHEAAQRILELLKENAVAASSDQFIYMPRQCSMEGEEMEFNSQS